MNEVRSVQALAELVETWGIVPFFQNSIPSFSIEEHTLSDLWFSDERDGPWEWMDFEYQLDKNGRVYGWGVARYATPERHFGAEFTDTVYRWEPEESKARILTHLSALLPEVPEQEIIHWMG